MGYEIKFYVVMKTGLTGGSEGTRNFAKIISTFNYSKDYAMRDWIDENYKPTNCYIFTDDGSTEILEDLYGEPLIEIPIKDMIDYLEKNNDDYRGIKPLLALLKAFDEDNETKWGNDLVVLKYGY